MNKMIAMILTAVLLLTMVFPVLAEAETYDLDASKLMDKWVYIDSTAVMTPMGQIKEGETAAVYPCYGLLNVVYCARPESARSIFAASASSSGLPNGAPSRETSVSDAMITPSQFLYLACS